MSKLPNNEKYIMFLQPIYFKKHYFNSTYKKIKRDLENKGIILFNIQTFNTELKFLHKKIKNKYNITFDDMLFPNINTLYINLHNNQYYNNNIYIKKKVEIEKNMLFILAGKLGVKTIKYESDIIETTITKINKNEFNKTIINKKGLSGIEEYSNNGAPLYFKSNSVQEVEKNIQEKIDIINNHKLRTFIYKRFEFKMLKLEYNIETEDLTELLFAVNMCFNKYGLTYDKNISYTENIRYSLEFFTDYELKKQFAKIKRNYIDKFYNVRELYEIMDDPANAIILLIEYVINYAKNNNFGDNLQKYIKDTPPEIFEQICHQFQNTSQIKNWLRTNFLEDNKNILEHRSITPTFNNISNENENINYIELDKEVPLITPMSMTPDALSLNVINERLLINNNYDNNNNYEYIDIVPINLDNI